jgi:hypothetical protein
LETFPKALFRIIPLNKRSSSLADSGTPIVKNVAMPIWRHDICWTSTQIVPKAFHQYDFVGD